MILRGDFNNDGDYEKLVVANTKQEEEKSNSDIYSVAFIVNESGSIQVLYGQFGEIDIPDFCHYLSFLGAYDLDGDGKYEFGFKDQEWEWGSTFIIGQNTDGKWEVLLKSDWGM